MYWIYILECKYNKYYIGMTTKLLTRVNRHVIGQGSNTTKRWKPITLIAAYRVNVNLNKREEEIRKAEAEDLENDITYDMMFAHGIENVRGGMYCEEFIKDSVLKNRSKQRPLCKCGLPVELYDKEKGKCYECPIKRLTWLKYTDNILQLPYNYTPCDFHVEIHEKEQPKSLLSQLWNYFT